MMNQATAQNTTENYQGRKMDRLDISTIWMNIQRSILNVEKQNLYYIYMILLKYKVIEIEMINRVMDG